ncbi:MAG: hypothetical protein QOJ32_1166 [Frankiaceae bacterium]|nr:hypothetical protein [Frankiaceae bacterium]
MFFLVLGWLGLTAFLARSHLVDVRSEVTRLQKDVSAGNTDRLTPGLASIQADAASARRWTSDPIWWLASHVPVLGHTFAASSGLAKATDQLASHALPPLVDAGNQLSPAQVRRKDGTVELARLTAAAPPLAAADSALADARTTVAALPSTGLVAPVATAREQFATQLTDLAGSLDAATRAARVGPAMLGENGPRRYLVIFQNPAEARGTGGLAGSFAVVRADNGKLSRERTGSDSELIDAPRPVVDLGPDFDAQWRKADGDRGWRNANFTPHYPWAAEIWQKLWERQSGERIDGVITLDPLALGYLLKVTGPVTLSDGEVLTGDNVATWALSTEYFKYADDNERRKDLLTELGEKAFDRIKDGNGSSAALLKAMGRAAGEHRILFWAARPEEQASILGTPIAGTVLDTPGPIAALVLNNGGTGKGDYYVDRTLTYQVLSCGDRTRRVRATIAMKNNAPSSGLPAYVGFRVDRPSRPSGQTRTFVNYYASSGAVLTGASVDGKAATVQVGQERTHPDFTFDVEINPGSTKTMVLEYDEPRTSAHLTVPVQPLARPMTVRIADSC